MRSKPEGILILMLYGHTDTETAACERITRIYFAIIPDTDTELEA